ncbi:uncharacterized protein LOC129741598 [Uranotaenia lowii]|uniref:uncharacterized protein LOC129741598 n=1 Tax=Uranotaenia lowii TaxID=190385 RepID=UPI0024790E58|nr:uncharacterized protein LOC129741598 [Uranotaenia lowii]
MTHLMDTDRTCVEVVDHPTLSFTKGVVFEPDTKDWDDSDLLKELSHEGVTEIKRITSKDKKTGAIKNTPLLILTFKGTKRPKHIHFGMLRINVRTYYPSVLQCRSCAVYGHTRKHCSSEAVCFNCSQKHSLDKDTDCPNPAYCYHCEGAHSPISKSCPVFRKEEAVVRVKIDKNVTYREAREEVLRTTSQNSYSSQLQHRLHEQSDKDRQIQLLQKEVEKLRDQLKEFALLRSQLEALQTVHQAAIKVNQQPEKRKPSPKPSESPSKARVSRRDSGKKVPSINQTPSQNTRQLNNQFTPNTQKYPNRSLSRKRYMPTSPTNQHDKTAKKPLQDHPIEDIRMRNTSNSSDDDYDE